MGNRKYLLKEIIRECKYVLAGVGGSLCLSVFLWLIFPPNKIPPLGNFPVAILTVSLTVATLMIFLMRRRFAPFLSSLILLLCAAFLSIGVYYSNKFFYLSTSFLITSALFFFLNLADLFMEEAFETKLLKVPTFSGREREPILSEKSIIGRCLFKNVIVVRKGDTILAICNSIEHGRAFAKKMIDCGRYGVYITADRPWTIIKEKFINFKGHLFCIDMFTNFYGLGEFKEAKDLNNLYPYTIRPVTIKELHSQLRDVRRRTLSRIKYNRGYSALNPEQKEEVEKELSSKDTRRERKGNARIIYDSVSALASIFCIDDLLKFLIHDTNVDKTIGRNTLLLVQKGVLDDSIIKKLESFCDICLNLRLIMNRRMRIHINKIRDENPPADFLINC